MASNITTATSQQSSSASFSLPINIQARVGIAILTLAFVLGFPGNLFVVWSVICQVKKRSVTCLLVMNLALADAFVLLSAPFFLRYLAGGRGWEFGSAVCKLVHYLSSVNMYVSIYLICLMSMDRWLAVTRPFLSQRVRTKHFLLVLLLVVWVMAFILSLPMPFYRSNLKKTFPPHNITFSFCLPYHWNSVGHQVFQYLSETIMGCLVPFSLITTCYTWVICRLQSAMFHRRAQGSRLILMIICTFALFWLPYHIVNIIQVIGLLTGSASVSKAATSARPNVTAFAYFSSAVNPILYVFAGSSHIRQAGLSFMGKLFEATNSESRSTSTFTRSARSSCPDESSALQALSGKLGNPFKSKNKEWSGSVAGKEVETLASAQQLE
ncbi:leukotriene B4 receptor 1 [Xiphias gladius]|uniref:leukotriene B4 receptor 1 n=1 Tax=Xiphias gladius TaxID=8245 RepID=UPI001A9811B7|nr:leukotriene B4 receptor 1 [Xiphias gladius]XP_039996566.1 leukotriene B4 receptor 1 [Xiphias gladius]XP_039996567.1 leukotriene B4 receptor 1 [Xiphias gladius]XP_039996568.1 leukotriene B4 receptor 1 [Xiphias gladius]XP_039996569.1 leukotriene B4 receptor 1 [Xiphias gladius]